MKLSPWCLHEISKAIITRTQITYFGLWHKNICVMLTNHLLCSDSNIYLLNFGFVPTVADPQHPFQGKLWVSGRIPTGSATVYVSIVTVSIKNCGKTFINEYIYEWGNWVNLPLCCALMELFSIQNNVSTTKIKTLMVLGIMMFLR